MLNLKPAGMLAVLSLATLGACATGEKISEATQVAPVPANASRIVVYRTNIMGGAVQPQVIVDGSPTGVCQPGGAFYVDVKPGQHRVSASTESTSSATVTTASGQSSYVECSIGFGVFIGRPLLKAKPAAEAAPAVRDLVLTGQFTLN
jgi:hypothetical protein